MQKIPVFIIDDQVLFCEALAEVIGRADNLEVIGAYTGGRAFLEALPALNTGETMIALIDMGMPGLDGRQLNDILQAGYPNIKTIVLTVFYNTVLIKQMIAARAAAYLEKSCNFQELYMTIEKVYENGHYYNAIVLKAINDTSDEKYPQSKTYPDFPAKLSKQEMKILLLICSGMKSERIGKLLFLSKRTVENHRSSISDKTKTHGSVELLRYAVYYKLISLDE